MITRAVCPVMIGREEELSLVEDALLAACRGDGSVVVLAGEAGVGKSRLATEIALRAEKIGAAGAGGGGRGDPQRRGAPPAVPLAAGAQLRLRGRRVES